MYTFVVIRPDYKHRCYGTICVLYASRNYLLIQSLMSDVDKNYKNFSSTFA